MSAGKTAMVWRLNEWQGGAPAAQAAEAVKLGLDEVSIKIVDGTRECWGSNRPQNCTLLSGTINALRGAGVEVSGWGWTYGGRYFGVGPARVFRKSAKIAEAEGRKAAELCIKYGIRSFWPDAETEYHRAGMEEVAEAYMLGLEAVAPDVDHFLCSYRWPKTHQPKFPVDAFAPFMEGWAPQVYFLGDNRSNGGAIQLEISKRQYDERIRELPYIGVAPTYQWRTWRASGLQLRLFFEKAVEIGCVGVSVWDLPQANQEQKDAIQNFDWPDGTEPPPSPPSEKIKVGVTVPVGKAEVTVREV